VFTTEFERTARLVTDAAGGAVEIAFDEGAVVAGRQRLPLSEVEFELKAGESKRLFDLARRVVAGTAAWLSTDTKAARGFRLVERRPVKPIKAPPSTVAPDATVEQAFQAIVRGCLAHLVANAPAVSERRDPEGVHQMRIALRRLRSAVKLFGNTVRSDIGAAVADRARTLGQLLGTARDFDVFEAETYAPVAEAFADDAAFPALIGSIRQRRDAAYDAVLDHLASPAYTAFLLDAGEWAEARLWRRPDDSDQAAVLDRPAADFAREVLARLHRKLRKAGKRLDRLGPQARHDLRKRLKRFRYALEFLAPLLSGDARLMIDRSARLQDALGVLNDGEIARTLLAHTGSLAQPGVHDWAAGAIAGWHAHAAAGHLAKTTRLWKRFRKDEALWRG
jgi:inorganic triphosphatase YgiF